VRDRDLQQLAAHRIDYNVVEAMEAGALLTKTVMFELLGIIVVCI
jgi:hypothetical protein